MMRNPKTVTVTWQRPGFGEPDRITVSQRVIVLIAVVFFLSVSSALALGAAAALLRWENNDLRAVTAALKSERISLIARLQLAEREIEEAREGLSKVRAEEAKIRSWLGLEAESAGGEPAADNGRGGKGSLGDVDLARISPEDRGTESKSAGVKQGDDIGSAVRSLVEDLGDLAAQVQERKKYWDAIPAISPIDGEHWISSAYGWRRSPFTEEREFHSGIDLAGQRGTPILAAADGKVVRVVQSNALGRTITLDHGNGIQTIYGHLEKTLVTKGQMVSRGQEIGTMGSSGKRSTGPHLHYVVEVDGKYVNPESYMLDRGRLPYPVARR